jgi:hypothetical protein
MHHAAQQLHAWHLTLHISAPAAGVQQYFPRLHSILAIPAETPLPLHNRRMFSKSVWDIKAASVRGVANLVLDYASQQDALKGAPLHSCS